MALIQWGLASVMVSSGWCRLASVWTWFDDGLRLVAGVGRERLPICRWYKFMAIDVAVVASFSMRMVSDRVGGEGFV